MFPKLSCHVYVFRQGLNEVVCDLFGWQARAKGDFNVSCYISSGKSAFIFSEIINVAHERNRAHAFSLNFERHLYLPLDVWIAKVPLHYQECIHLTD